MSGLTDHILLLVCTEYKKSSTLPYIPGVSNSVDPKKNSNKQNLLFGIDREHNEAMKRKVALEKQLSDRKKQEAVQPQITTNHEKQMKELDHLNSLLDNDLDDSELARVKKALEKIKGNTT